MLITLSEFSLVKLLQDSLDNIKTICKDTFSYASSSATDKLTTNKLTDFFNNNPSFNNTMLGMSPPSKPPMGIVTQQFFNEHKKEILSIFKSLIGLTVSATVSYFLFKWLMKHLDPTNSDKLEAKSRADHILKEIGLKNLELNEYELVIASNLIMPKNIDCSWEDIGGLEHIINDLRETVIYPLKDTNNDENKKTLNKRSRLIKPPSGVLFFGPPGNAKTMIAKALAKESGARFINLQITSLFDKWFGETQKRTEAIFSLAAKIQPVIIFIDEIDTFLRSRSNGDHECTSTMKTQFMTLWDGLTTTKTRQNRILIIGATNRPEDVDPAILRRMPQMFYIGLPNLSQRKQILNVILKEETLDSDVSLDLIAEKTANFSGSDLHELCRCAAMNSYIDSMKSNNNGQFKNESADQEEDPITVIRKCDFQVALDKMNIKNSVSKFNLHADREIDHHNQFD